MDRLLKTTVLKDLFADILNNAFDAIIFYLPIKNKKGIIVDFEFVYMNDSAFKFLSGNREKYIGKNFLTLFPYAAIDGMFDAFKKTAETGKSSEGIYYYEEGEYKGWYRDSVVKHGNGIIVYFRDVSSQKYLELEVEEKTKELENLLKEKELLLKETHHRIKNNLQLLASMINLQSNNIEDPRFRELFDVTRQRIINMARVHQGFYESRNFTSIKFNKFIREIVAFLFELYIPAERKIEINYEIEEVDLGINYSVNIGLIVNELITNSIKHAFNETSSGKINIIIKTSDGNLNLIVEDNGTGLRPDFKIEELNSFGLMLVESLVEQMHGTLRFTGASKTTVNINIPNIPKKPDLSDELKL
jgi:two-component sensor histidine kinase